MKTFLVPSASQRFPYSGSAAVAASRQAAIGQGILSASCAGSRSRTIGTVADETMSVSSTADRIVAMQSMKPMMRCRPVMPVDMAGTLSGAAQCCCGRTTVPWKCIESIFNPRSIFILVQ
ncbi:hypothetical protein ACFRFL_33695 [Streptomyces sp. NPDC056708]|uniref:hypothetical protein n=1 Tax=unclassified Streptomyces TaxID=2593676 RepID=UPI00369E6386